MDYVTNGYHGVLTQLEGNQKITPYLEEFYIEFYEPGVLTFDIDTWLVNTVKNSTPVVLGGEYSVESSDDVLLLMKNNLTALGSCYFTWQGSEIARIYVSDTTDDFTPSETSVYVDAYYDLEPGTPVQFIDHLTTVTKFWQQAKIVSDSPGVLTVSVLGAPPQGDAILLEYGKSVSLQANDDRVFCFPKGWKSTEFNVATNFVMNMYVSNTPEFKASSEDTNVFATYPFSKDGNKRQLQLSTKDISTLATSASDDYLYVRFQCNTATTLTPAPWNCSSCAAKSILITSGNQFTVPAKSSSTLYRLCYEDWKGYNFSIKWTGMSTLPTYFASVCDFMLTSADENVLQVNTVARRGTATITVAKSDLWASHVGEEGFVYVRFNPANQGKVTFTTTKPAEEDPEIITTKIA